MYNILIIGSRGVIGRNLYNYLRQEGMPKYLIYEFDVQIDKTQDLRTEIDIKNLKDIINNKNINYVFFLAFDVGGSKYLKNIIEDIYIEDNLLIMKNVFSEIKNIPFIFASSQMENMYNSYGTLKRLGEHYTNHYNQINVRFWNVYGKEHYDEKSHVITDIIYKAKHNNKITLLTNGKEERQFLHSDDCSIGLHTIMICHKEILKETNIIHLTNFKWTSILQVAQIVAKKYNCLIEYPEDKVDTLQIKQNQPSRYFLKYWKPTISLEEGINKLINNSN